MAVPGELEEASSDLCENGLTAAYLDPGGFGHLKASRLDSQNPHSGKPVRPPLKHFQSKCAPPRRANGNAPTMQVLSRREDGEMERRIGRLFLVFRRINNCRRITDLLISLGVRIRDRSADDLKKKMMT